MFFGASRGVNRLKKPRVSSLDATVVRCFATYTNQRRPDAVRLRWAMDRELERKEEEVQQRKRERDDGGRGQRRDGRGSVGDREMKAEDAWGEQRGEEREGNRVPVLRSFIKRRRRATRNELLVALAQSPAWPTRSLLASIVESEEYPRRVSRGLPLLG